VDYRSKCDDLENKLKLAERQRADLMSAFRKQMKLIDLLKRQKVRPTLRPTPCPSIRLVHLCVR